MASQRPPDEVPTLVLEPAEPQALELGRAVEEPETQRQLIASKSKSFGAFVSVGWESSNVRVSQSETRESGGP